LIAFHGFPYTEVTGEKNSTYLLVSSSENYRQLKAVGVLVFPQQKY